MNQSKPYFRPGLLLLAVAFILLFADSMGTKFGHDQQQFVAPGIVSLKMKLLPYRDFPLFHMPNIVMINGLLSEMSEYRLFFPQLLSAILAALTLAALAVQSRRWLSSCGQRYAAILTAALVGMALVSPIFLVATPHPWNHPGTILLVTLAFMVWVAGFERRLSQYSFFFVGLLLGLAIGFRLTAAPLMAPFGLACLFWSASSWRQRLIHSSLFSAGILLALTPSLFLFFKAPEPFLFGNFGYSKFSNLARKYPFWDAATYRIVDAQQGFLGGDLYVAKRTIGNKLLNFVHQGIPLNWPIFLLWFSIGVPGCLWRIYRCRDKVALLLFLLIAFTLWGSVAPPRYHPQYYSALLPVLVLMIAYGFAALQRDHKFRSWVLFISAISLLGSIPDTAKLLAKTSLLITPGKWELVKTHKVGLEMRSLLPKGRVLTIKLMHPLEAGLDIYPELAIADFGWRCAHLLSAAERKKYKLVSPFELKTLLQERPADGVLIADEEEPIEKPFADYAKERGFAPHTLENGFVFWTAPGS